MHARAFMCEGSADRIDEAARVVQDRLQVGVMPGNIHSVLLVDRTTGKGLTITLWESQEDMRAARQPASPNRSRINEKLASQAPPVVQQFKVINEMAR